MLNKLALAAIAALGFASTAMAAGNDPLNPVSEPSMLALAAVGVAALMFKRRK